jgi:hypothetical protein
MIIVASASSDTYITNKIIDSLPAVSGNVGRAGTLDLFKLYDESTVVTGAVELSRVLIKFDLSKAATLSSSTLKIEDPSFSAKLRLRNISTGQPVPNNFTVQVFPLAVPFEEGYGRDVISYADVDSSNFLSSSAGTLWNVSGAFKSGTLGSSGIDYYSSGNLQDGNGIVNLGSTQAFVDGTEDLVIDVSNVVSATIAGLLPNHGFRISFVDSQETDSTTRFVKRFASRHVRQQSLRPTLLVSCDDSIVDHHSSSYFDVTSSLYLHNIMRGEYKNIVSGSSLTSVTGANSLLVRLSTGSFSKYVTGSQAKVASFLTGVYYADVALFSGDASVVSGTTTVKSVLTSSGSITFDEVWTSLDGTVTYFSSSLTMRKHYPSTKSAGVRKIRSSMLSTPTNAQRGQLVRLRTVFYDDYDSNRSAKFAFEPTPLEIASCRVRVRDQSTGELIFDFGDTGSKMSSDSLSNYFDLHTDALPVGVPLSFEYQIVTAGETLQVTSKNFTLTLSE